MNKKNSKTIGIIIGIVLFLGVVGGLTYAWLSFTTNNIAVVGTTHCFNINYSKGQDITGNLGRIEESDYLTSNTIKLSSAMAWTNVTMELDSRCYKVNGVGTIELNVNDLSEEYTENGSSPESLKYVLAEYDPSLYSNLTIDTLKNQTFNYLVRGSITKEGRIDIYSEYLNPGEKHNYLLIVYIDKDMSTTDVIGESFSGSITARAEQLTETPLNKFLYVLGSDSTTYSSLPIYDFTDDTSTSLSNREEVDYELEKDLEIEEDEILLTGYKGNDKVIYVPDTYTINGDEYKVKFISNIRTWESYTEENEESVEHGFNVMTTYGTFQNIWDVEEIYIGNNVVAIEAYSENEEDSGWVIGSMQKAFHTDVSLRKAVIPATTTWMGSTFGNCYSLEEIDINSEKVYDANTLLYAVDNFGENDDKVVNIKVPSNSLTYDVFLHEPYYIEDTYMGKVNLILKSSYDLLSYDEAQVTPIEDFEYVLGSDNVDIDSITIYNITSDFSTTRQNTKELYTFDLDNTLSIEEDEVLLTAYTGNDLYIKVPDTYEIDGNEYRVKILSHVMAGYSYGLFQNNTTVRAIYFGDNVTAVEEYADADSGWLEGSLHRAFRDDISLKKVILPSTITWMDAAFTYCYQLEEVIIKSRDIECDDYSCVQGLFAYNSRNIKVIVPVGSSTYNTFNEANIHGTFYGNGDITLVGY